MHFNAILFGFVFFGFSVTGPHKRTCLLHFARIAIEYLLDCNSWCDIYKIIEVMHNSANITLITFNVSQVDYNSSLLQKVAENLNSGQIKLAYKALVRLCYIDDVQVAPSKGFLSVEPLPAKSVSLPKIYLYSMRCFIGLEGQKVDILYKFLLRAICNFPSNSSSLDIFEMLLTTFDKYMFLVRSSGPGKSLIIYLNSIR